MKTMLQSLLMNDLSRVIQLHLMFGEKHNCVGDLVEGFRKLVLSYMPLVFVVRDRAEELAFLPFQTGPKTVAIINA